MTRLTKLDNDEYRWLADDDECYHYGEYTSKGGFRASDTNQQIWNLKNKPTAGKGALYYKGKAVDYWGSVLVKCFELEYINQFCTLIPMPCSKPTTHVDYDDRMLQVLKSIARRKPSLDIRPLIIQTEARESQHLGARLTPTELRETLAINRSLLNTPIKPHVIVFDDVITMGSSFNAAQKLLREIPGVQTVMGVFLAKTVWDRSEFDDILDAL